MLNKTTKDTLSSKLKPVMQKRDMMYFDRCDASDDLNSASEILNCCVY